MNDWRVKALIFFAAVPLFLAFLNPILCADNQEPAAKKVAAQNPALNAAPTEEKSSIASQSNAQEPCCTTSRGFSHWIDKWVTSPIAVFTFYILIVTAGLVMFTYDLWGSTAMLAKGDEREFYMAHRPKMVLRSVRIERDEKGNPLGIICVLVNAGDTPAVITSRLNYNVDSLGRYSVNKTLSRAIPAYGDIWHDIPKQIFKPEERLPIFIPFESVQVDGMSGRQILLGNKALHFYGFIAFSNELRTDERPHAFYWIYNPDTMKFAESENDEYGY